METSFPRTPKCHTEDHSSWISQNAHSKLWRSLMSCRVPHMLERNLAENRFTLVEQAPKNILEGYFNQEM